MSHVFSGLLDHAQRCRLRLEMLSMVREANPAAFGELDALDAQESYRTVAHRARAALEAIPTCGHSDESAKGRQFAAALADVDRSRLTFVPFLSRLQSGRVR